MKKTIQLIVCLIIWYLGEFLPLIIIFWSLFLTFLVPKCYIPSDYIGYKVKTTKRDFSHIFVTLERQIGSGLPEDLKVLSIVITFLNDKSLRIKIEDQNEKRFEPPIPQLHLPYFLIALNPLYEVDVDNNGIHWFQNKRVIFSTELSKLIFSDQFIQLKNSLISNKIYGLGEHKAKFLKSTNWQILTLVNHRDRVI